MTQENYIFPQTFWVGFPQVATGEYTSTHAVIHGPLAGVYNVKDCLRRTQASATDSGAVT